MNTKLTLSLDKDIIEQAKIYAKSNNRSLSDMVENYFKTLTPWTESKRYKELMNTEDKVESPMEKYGGIMKDDGKEKFDYKKELTEALIKKYVK
jgi:Family of unknown function (DUF6364)